MSVAIFVIGVLVFLITVFGTVMAGGLLLTGRQLDSEPELDPGFAEQTSEDSEVGRLGHVASTDF